MISAAMISAAKRPGAPPVPNWAPVWLDRLCSLLSLFKISNRACGLARLSLTRLVCRATAGDPEVPAPFAAPSTASLPARALSLETKPSTASDIGLLPPGAELSSTEFGGEEDAPDQATGAAERRGAGGAHAHVVAATAGATKPGL